MKNFLVNSLGSLLSIKEHEWAKLILLFCLYFILGIALAIGRNFSEALFVAQVGVDNLPMMFVYTSFFSVLSFLLYAVFADRVKNYRIFMSMNGMMIVILLLVFIGMFLTLNRPTSAVSTVLIYILYISYVVFGLLAVSHFALFLQDHYNPLESKRLIPIILTSSRFGGILGGIIVSVVASNWDSIYLMLVWAFFLGFAIFLTHWTEKKFPTVSEIERMTKATYRDYTDNLKEGYRYISRSRFLVVVAISVFAMYFMRNYIDYLNNAMFTEIYPSRNELIAFYGTFAAVIDIIGAVLQLFVAPRIITRLRVGAAGIIFPLTSFIAMIGIGLASLSGLGIWGAAAFARFNRYGLYNAFNNPVYALFFNAVPTEMRARVRGFITGIVVPIGTLTSGLLMMVLVKMPNPFLMIALLGIASAGLFLYVSFSRSREYSRALLQLIKEGRFTELALTDANLGGEYNEQSKDLLLKVFRSDDDAMALFSAQILMEISPETLLEVIPEKVLSPQASNYIQKELILLLDQIPNSEDIFLQISQQMINDDSEDIRALTIELLDHCDIDAYDLVYEKFQNGTQKVQRMAAVYLLHRADSKIRSIALDSLIKWSRDDDEIGQLITFEVMGKTRDVSFLTTLFGNINIANENLTQVILNSINEIYQANETKISRKSVHFNEVTEFDLLNLFEESVQRHKSMDAAISIAKILSLFQHVESIRRLSSYLGSENYELNDTLMNFYRKRGDQALNYLAENFISVSSESKHVVETRVQDAVAIILAPYLRFREQVENYLNSELEKVYRRFIDIETFNQYVKIDEGYEDILDALQFFKEVLMLKIDQTINKVIRILSEMGDKKSLATVNRVLHSKNPRHRAQALETLENVSIPSIVKLLQPVIGQNKITNEIRNKAGEHFGLEQKNAGSILYNYTKDNDSWIRTTAIEVVGLIVGYNFPPSLFAELDKFAEKLFFKGLKDSNTFVREACCVALKRSGYLYKNSYDNLIHALYESNQTLMVRIQAIQAIVSLRREEEHLLPDGVTKKGAWLNMLSTIEKTVALRRVPIFSRLNLEQLKTLSNICMEELIQKDETLFLENELGDRMYVILEGKIGIIKDYKKDSEFQLTVMKAGAPLGEMSMFADDEKRSATAVCTEQTHLLTINKDELQALVRRFPDISFSIIRGLNEKIRQSNQQVLVLEDELNALRSKASNESEQFSG